MKWIIDRAFLFVILSLGLTMAFSIGAYYKGGVFSTLMYFSIGTLIFSFALCFFRLGR